jgi:hypothetical protein
VSANKQVLFKISVMRKLFLLTLSTAFILSVAAQDKNMSDKKNLTPYVGVFAGGCVDNPFSFMAGVQKKIRERITLAADLHYWNTGYECYCDDVYSKGKFRSFTPSVKIIYNTGKKEGNGFIAGVGLGYMFAKDRGTEQPYTYDAATNLYETGKDISPGNWDFNSIAPSFTLGVGFRVLKIPVSFLSIYYFAKATDGWTAAAGGAGFKIGLKKFK